MRPYGQHKTVKGATYKQDFHMHSADNHKLLNWWECICEKLSRSRMKHLFKKEIEKELNETDNDNV